MANLEGAMIPSEDDISALQSQIREIINVCDSLRTENSNLRKQALGLMADKKGLIRINETARERLQVIIGRLRELESASPGPSKDDPDPDDHG